MHKVRVIKESIAKIRDAALIVKYVRIEPDGKIVSDSEQVTLPGNNLAGRPLQATKPFRADSIVGINS